MHDLKSPEGVVAYLKGTRFAASDAQLLSGGQSAFTYRVVLEVPLETGEETIVIKHFEGYLAAHEPMKWDVQRADHEYKALSAIATSGLFDSESVVQLPRPLEYDQHTHTIFMTDLGSPIPVTQVLENGFPGAQPSESGKPLASNEMYKLAWEIGQAVGDFMGRFHNWSSLPEQSALRSYFALNPGVIQHSVYIHHFCLGLSADRFQMREAWIDDFIAKDQQEALSDGGTLIMGDCSLHNILASPPSKDGVMRVYLTDLEMARASYPELDIGELTASTVSFSRLCCPNIEQPFISALHQAYRRHRTSDPGRVGLATGMDFMGLGTVLPWAREQSETKLQGLAATGLEVLRSSFKEDGHSIKANPILQHLFSTTSQQMI
ncbi:kinase-like domain-containing protein [Rhizoctonia solani]|nr:kinase-like domain-containing protein [Rhizoctonia solani]